MYFIAAPSVLIKESTSTTSIQSVDRYQHLRHSRMEPRDSYMNMADTGLESRKSINFERIHVHVYSFKLSNR